MIKFESRSTPPDRYTIRVLRILRTSASIFHNYLFTTARIGISSFFQLKSQPLLCVRSIVISNSCCGYIFAFLIFPSQSHKTGHLFIYTHSTRHSSILFLRSCNSYNTWAFSHFFKLILLAYILRFFNLYYALITAPF